MALTFDDLPYATAGQPDLLPKAQRTTDTLLRVLASHGAPSVGFVIEGALRRYREDAGTILLQRWIDAGAILGHHTYSHPDLNNVTAERFIEDEIIKGDVVTRRLMQSRQPYQMYFRHPMTHTGDTEAKKRSVERFLATRGYKVAPHTIENADFVFNVPYVRSLNERDDALATRLRSAYLDFTLAATEFAEQVAPNIFGREIPQTILLHANDINADCLDDLLRRLEARGYRFITLDEAMRDPAYATEDSVVSRSGPTWLWRWMTSKGMSVSFRDDPEPPAWVVELFQRRVR